MRAIKYFLSVFTISLTTFLAAQSTDPVLIRINKNTTISKSDFEYAYKKDKKSDINKEESLTDFLGSYINFLLNIEEAKKHGLDKELSFTEEYSTYIEQIEKPYLIDSISPLEIAKSIYNRLNENIEVSHILIKFPSGSILPEDTLNIYKKAHYIKELLSKKDAPSFESLVTKYSEDSISKSSRIPGYLGWKTALAGPLEFEEFIYNNPIGSVSDPIRTNMGYHLIKIHGKRPDPGQVNISHILLAYPQENPTQAEKDNTAELTKQVYNELLAGGNFEELSQKYSSDKTSAARGGALGWFGVNRPIAPVFESKIFAMEQVGEITTPIEMKYGYHIFKLLDKQPLLSWETMKPNLIKAIETSDRKQLLTKKQIKNLSEKYPYKVNKKTYDQVREIANSYTLSDTVFFEKITPYEEKYILNIGNSNYTVRDFIFYLQKNPFTDDQLSTDILNNKLNDFILDRLIDTERNLLFMKYPEFGNLAKEFHDGILYFNIMNQNVWEKAQTSRPELQALFDRNPQKYAWSAPKYKGYIIHAKSKETIERIKALAEGNKNTKDLKQLLTESLDQDTLKNIIIEKGLWAKGENPYVDKTLYSIENNNEIIGYPEFIIEGKLISVPESLDDVYGEVTADYQNILEQEWIDHLRKEYKVEVDQNVLDSIK